MELWTGTTLVVLGLVAFHEREETSLTFYFCPPTWIFTVRQRVSRMGT